MTARGSICNRFPRPVCQSARPLAERVIGSWDPRWRAPRGLHRRSRTSLRRRVAVESRHTWGVRWSPDEQARRGPTVEIPSLLVDPASDTAKPLAASGRPRIVVARWTISADDLGPEEPARLVPVEGTGGPIGGARGVGGGQADFSPDGGLIALTSRESGRNEVYVQLAPPAAALRRSPSTVGQTRAGGRTARKSSFCLPTGRSWSPTSGRAAPSRRRSRAKFFVPAGRSYRSTSRPTASAFSCRPHRRIRGTCQSRWSSTGGRTWSRDDEAGLPDADSDEQRQRSRLLLRTGGGDTAALLRARSRSAGASRPCAPHGWYRRARRRARRPSPGFAAPCLGCPHGVEDARCERKTRCW